MNRNKFKIFAYNYKQKWLGPFNMGGYRYEKKRALFNYLV